MAKPESTEEKIRESLIDQLKTQNKRVEYTLDLVETYVAHWRVKQALIRDIEENGIRVSTMTGNGFECEKPNTSIGDLQKETSIMLAILDKLGLKDPVLKASMDEYM